MNDQFLTQFHKSPRPAFARTLYERISHEKPSLASRLAGRLTLHIALVVFAALVLIAACTYAVIAPKWVKVGEYLLVQERNSTNTFEGIAGPPSLSQSPLLSVEEAANQVSYKFKVPTWGPTQFKVKGAATFDETNSPYPLVNIFWEQGETEKVPYELALQIINAKLWIVNGYHIVSFGMQVGKGSTIMTEVNGQPAALIHGDWEFYISNKNFKWAKQATLQLLWREGEIVYRIYAINSSISAAALIRMAESAR
jgi:hypothetical protein